MSSRDGPEEAITVGGDLDDLKPQGVKLSTELREITILSFLLLLLILHLINPITNYIPPDPKQ